jgi:hypothetical protein
MFPYTTPVDLLSAALIESKQAKHSRRLLTLNITAEKWSDALQLQITQPLFVMYTFYF